MGDRISDLASRNFEKNPSRGEERKKHDKEQKKDDAIFGIPSNVQTLE